MSTETTEGPPRRRTWLRRIGGLLIGLAASMVAGAIIERVSDAEWLEGAKAAQIEWIETISKTSPVGVAELYISEVTSAYTGNAPNGEWSGQGGSKAWLAAPFIAFMFTIARFFYDGGMVALVQIGLGALAVVVFNFVRSKRQTILFDAEFFNLILMPVAIMVAASLIGMVLWGVMIGALKLLSGITGLAATAAASTGIVGFCWYCVAKLGEKGAEHVLTPKI